MKYGFTLVELLVVVLIVGVLAGIGLPQYQLAVQKARFSKALSRVKQIHRAEEVFFLEHGYFAPNLELLDLSFPDLKLFRPGPDRIAHYTSSIFSRDLSIYANHRGPDRDLTIDYNDRLPARIRLAVREDLTVVICMAGYDNKKAMAFCNAIGAPDGIVEANQPIIDPR